MNGEVDLTRAKPEVLKLIQDNIDNMVRGIIPLGQLQPSVDDIRQRFTYTLDEWNIAREYAQKKYGKVEWYLDEIRQINKDLAEGKYSQSDINEAKAEAK